MLGIGYIYISELYKRPLIYDLSSPPASCPPVISSVAMNDAWFSNRCTFVVQVEFILVPSATRFQMPKKNESSGVRMTEIRFTSHSGLPWRLLINLCSKYINVCVFSLIKNLSHLIDKIRSLFTLFKQIKQTEIAQPLWSHVANKPGTFFLDYILLSIKISTTTHLTTLSNFRRQVCYQAVEVI